MKDQIEEIKDAIVCLINTHGIDSAIREKLDDCHCILDSISDIETDEEKLECVHFENCEATITEREDEYGDTIYGTEFRFEYRGEDYVVFKEHPYGNEFDEEQETELEYTQDCFES